MPKFIPWLALAAIVLGVAGLAVTTERASADLPDVASRFDLRCQQIVAPNYQGEDPPRPEALPLGFGLVRCSLTVDIPQLMPNWPDTIKLTIWAVYKDVDGNNRPSPGDRLICIKVVGPGIDIERCRPGVLVPPNLSFPASP